MTKKLVRRIPAKRLRPGLAPDDVVVNVVGLSAPVSPEQQARDNLMTVLYEVCADGVTLPLGRMEDIEGRFGAETVFEDHTGTCYVALTVFDLREDGSRWGMAPREERAPWSEFSNVNLVSCNRANCSG